jgi:2-dehydropantoate 2-reductase
VIQHIAGNGLIFGEPGGGESQRLKSLVDLFAGAGFAATASPRIQKDIWYKLWGNMTMNPISALTAATCDRILDDDLVEAFILRVMTEAQEIGARIGCPIEESGRDRIAVTRRLGAFKTSMLQDVEAGRAVELDALLGAPREIGRIVGVKTPDMDTLFGLLRLFAQQRGLYPQGA